MRNKSRWLAGAVIALALVTVNISIWQKEQLLKQGAIMILPLAPVDPRSLMQGDYMALNYALTRSLEQTLYQQAVACGATRSSPCLPTSRTLIVDLDAQRHATLARFDQGEPLQTNQLRVKYHQHSGSLTVGTNAYFFQEGHGERFAQARYGAFRVGNDGTALLTDLLNEQGKVIQP